jgi:GT2 family glycosyltransferase
MTRATIVVTQRERFGMTEESLENLYANTETPFDLIYVDGKSPRKTAEYLREASERHGFTLIREERYLTPNQARNIALARTETDYVVFVDNDTLYTPGWLKALVDCADETGADIVAPLTCHALPAHETIHHAGGEYTDPDRLDAFFAADASERDFHETMYGHNDKVADWQAEGRLRRRETQFCEFHVVLARRAAFDRIGPLDEAMLSTKEHLDFSMSVRAAGGTVWFEPASVVTYVFPNRHRPLEPADWPFFALRWSDDYGRRSLEHFLAKWNLNPPEGYVKSKRGIYAGRREQAILTPLMRRVPGLATRQTLLRGAVRLLGVVERRFNRLLVAYHGTRA